MAKVYTRTAAPAQPTGVTISAVHGIDKVWSEEAGVLVDRTIEFTTGVGVQFMANQDDYVYFGWIGQQPFEFSSAYGCNAIDLHIALSVLASTDLGLTFEYWGENNQWNTLAVTDNTNGFTQDGTIEFDRTKYPAYSTNPNNQTRWERTTVQDATQRFYLRIKRTTAVVATPPTINEAGSGGLTANTTYYYKVWGMFRDADFLSRSPRRSVPSTEANGTTTTIKRTLKVSWNNAADVENYFVMRTPVSGDYAIDDPDLNIFYQKLADVDRHPQTVNCKRFEQLIGRTSSEDFTEDTGLIPYNIYTSSIGLAGIFTTFMYTEKERGNLLIQGGTDSDPISWLDIYDEYVAQGWTGLERTLDPDTADEVWILRDNIDMEDYFTDKSFTLIAEGAIRTDASTQVIFGDDSAFGSQRDFYKDGGKFVFRGSPVEQFTWFFKNTKFYRAIFRDDSRSRYISSRNYVVLEFSDDCELYNCDMTAKWLQQDFIFSGANLVVKDFGIMNSRFGLNIEETAAPTIDIENVRIDGSNCLNFKLSDGQEITLPSITFNSVNRVVRNWPATDQFLDNTLHLTDPVFVGLAPVNSSLGINGRFDLAFSFDLTVEDKDGNGLSGATVTIKDKDGVDISGSPFTTDIRGEIGTQLLKTDFYVADPTNPYPELNSYYAKLDDTNNPYTLKIEKDGYDDYELSFTIEEKTAWTVAMIVEDLVVREQNITAVVTTDEADGSKSDDTVSGTQSDDGLSGSVSDDEVSGSQSNNNITGQVT